MINFCDCWLSICFDLDFYLNDFHLKRYFYIRFHHNVQNRKVRDMSQVLELKLNIKYCNFYWLFFKIKLLFFPYQIFSYQIHSILIAYNSLNLTICPIASNFQVLDCCSLSLSWNITESKESNRWFRIEGGRACSFMLCYIIFSRRRHCLWIFISTCSWIAIKWLYCHFFIVYFRSWTHCVNGSFAQIHVIIFGWRGKF